MTEIAEVAEALLEAQGPMTTMKLQKLVFYAQAYSLVRDRRPLFPSKFEAWVNGPVAPDLYRMHRGKFMVWPGDLLPTKRASGLGQRGREIVSIVSNRLGSLTGEELRELSHAEEPWVSARKGLSPRDRGHEEITTDSMVRYYSCNPGKNPLFA